ncbi:alpha 1,2 mannosyltransferase [Thoreauomyces humboldtii]|nr:alpha 1,2 mannosyltransferase [Thoreauomyces humboldtii]
MASRPSQLIRVALPALVTAALCIAIDTWFYGGAHMTVTPWNNFKYNADPANLALHGTHPRWTHMLVNLPALIGPGILMIRPRPLFPAAASGILALSLFSHQEARFLMPAVVLLLSCVSLPRHRTARRWWWGSWIIFNCLAGVIMGVYHQGGVVPASLYVGSLRPDRVIWWKTYQPPTYLLATNTVETIDLKGAPLELLEKVISNLPCGKTVLVAPWSAVELDAFKERTGSWGLREQWRWTSHLNLDDLDFEEEGPIGTWKRVIGRRGLVVWKIAREACNVRPP